MKLKKIASLALAGIMAVSMLTACGEGTNNGDSGSSSSQPTTANIVSTVKNAIADKNGDLVITVEENTALSDAMKKYNEDNDRFYPTLSEDSVRDDVLKVVFGVSRLNADMQLLDANDMAVIISGNFSGPDNPDYRYAVISNGTGSSADAVRTLAANQIAESVKDLENVIVHNNKTTNMSYTMYVYEGSMVTNDNKTEPYVIAILKVKADVNV